MFVDCSCPCLKQRNLRYLSAMQKGMDKAVYTSGSDGKLELGLITGVNGVFFQFLGSGVDWFYL